MTVSNEDEIKQLREQSRRDRKLLRHVEQALGEINRTTGLTDEQTDVLAAVRIRLEGKDRGSLDDLLSAAGDLSRDRDLSDVLGTEESGGRDWPEVKEESRDWPGL